MLSGPSKFFPNVTPLARHYSSLDNGCGLFLIPSAYAIILRIRFIPRILNPSKFLSIIVYFQSIATPFILSISSSLITVFPMDSIWRKVFLREHFYFNNSISLLLYSLLPHTNLLSQSTSHFTTLAGFPAITQSSSLYSFVQTASAATIQ